MPELPIVAHIETDFPEKFGIPRQSGLADLSGRIFFEPAYQMPESVRGLDQFSHLWLLWQFSQTADQGWQPTVRPPKLGGNRRMGVFATRSPFRPSPIGLSCVRLEKIEFSKEKGPVLFVRGADLANGTPIFDIKPYLAYADAYPHASHGFACENRKCLQLNFPLPLLEKIPKEKRKGLMEALQNDPRPGYHHAAEKEYRFSFAGYAISFFVQNGVLTVCDMQKELKEEREDD